MARRPKVTEPETTNQPSTEEGASGEQPTTTSKIEWPKILQCPFPSCTARFLSNVAKDVKPGIKACIKCGAGLTPMNEAPKVEPPKSEAKPEPATETRKDEARPGGGSRATMPGRSSRDVAAPNPEDVGETVSATWGEELYTPQQFFSFRVGSFTRTTKIREGETAISAKRRIYAELKQMADDEREEKLRIFLDTVGYLFKQVKGEKS